MKIESIIKRIPPTEVVLGDTTYKFAPEGDRHIADVTDTAHIAKLLSIPEGYRLFDGETLPTSVTDEMAKNAVWMSTAAVVMPVEDEALKGSIVHPVTIDLGNGKVISIDDVVAEAHMLSAMTTSEWNAMPDDARHDLIDAVLDAMSAPGGLTEDEKATVLAAELAAAEALKVAAAAKPVTDEAAAREVAALEYKARFGGKPHYKWSIEKIREELAKPEAQ